MRRAASALITLAILTGLIVWGPDVSAADVTLWSETFEGAFPTGTEKLRYCSYGYTWDDDACRASTGSRSGWCAGGRYATNEGYDPCAKSYPNDLCAMIVAGPFDLSDATTAMITYDLWLRSDASYQDFFYVGFSVDGTSFVFGDQLTGDLGDAWSRNRTYSMARAIGRPAVWIGIGFFSNGWGHPAVTPNGAFVDNIRVVKTTGGAQALPDLVVTDQQISLAAFPIQVRAKVRNQGTAAAPAGMCRFWLGSIQWGDAAIGALAAGQEEWSAWCVPSALEVRVCVDVAGQIQEQVESNNCLEVIH